MYQTVTLYFESRDPVKLNPIGGGKYGRIN